MQGRKEKDNEKEEIRQRRPMQKQRNVKGFKIELSLKEKRHRKERKCLIDKVTVRDKNAE